MENEISIQPPRKIIVPAADALRWRTSGGFIFSRKYDGIFVEHGVRCANHVLVSERMRPKSGGKFTVSDRTCFEMCERLNTQPEFYAAHSVAVYHGENVLRQSNAQRWAFLRSIFRGGAQFTDDGVRIVLADSGNGGEFFQAVIEAGGEGVCAVNSDSPWGIIYASKPLLELKVLVTGKDIATGCLEIADRQTLQPLGRVPCKAQFERVRIGDIVEVHCLERHQSGKLREARFVAVRNQGVTIRFPINSTE